MSKKNISFLFVLASAFFLSISTCYAESNFGAVVNAACAPETPYTNNDCALCHTGGFSAPTAAKDAYLAGGTTLTDFFCPSGPTCTDSDGDTFSIEGGVDCGPVDCNDTDPAINPGAVENCTDGIDNDCDGLIDTADPNAVGCPPVCTDSDGDTYAVEGGACGLVDCDDTNATVNPGATEICGDGLDNTCNGVVDEGCMPTCTDSDGDTYAVEGGACGAVDCNDTDATINPGATEIPNDGIDQDCSGADVICGDADGDGICNAVDGSDSDGDGFTDAEEVLCGSDPALATSKCSGALPFLFLLLD